MQKNELDALKIEKKEGSEVVITGELPFESLVKHRVAVIAEMGQHMDIDGFRKGHIPERIIVQRVGDMAILTEMAERALSRAYPEMVVHHKLDVIGYPQIRITKIAEGNPLGFSITVAVVPGITLADYTKIAKDINANKESKEVTDEEVTNQINDILRQKVAYERIQAKATKNAHVHDHEHGEDHDHDHDEEPIEDAKDIPLPELTDEYVKGLGKEGQFASVEDFKAKIREHLTIQKAQEVDSRHRAKITDAIIEKSVFEIPKVLVDVEINQMFGQMEEDLTRAQLKMEDYLTHIKKTKEDLAKEWAPHAEKRARLQLVLNEIAKKEEIVPDAGIVDNEVSHLLERYKDADESRVRTYVSSVLANEAVMKKLETM